MHPCLLNYYDRFFLTLSKVTEIVFPTVNNSLIMNMKTIQKLTTVYKWKNDISSTHRKVLPRMPNLYSFLGEAAGEDWKPFLFPAVSST